MKQIKKFLHILLFPKTAVLVLCVFIAAAMLIYTFGFCGEDGIFAYISYAFSAYALVILCLGFVPAIRRIKSFKRQFADKNKYFNLYMQDINFKTRISLYCSLTVNTVYALLKFVSGIFYGSAWLITLAAYYGLLLTMRFLLLRHVGSRAGDLRSEWKRCRLCGIVLIFMNIILTCMIILVLHRNEGFIYTGYLIYVMAMYDFYTMITSVINLVKSRKHNRPVLSTTRAVIVAAALISMLSLETAMITQFGDESDTVFRHVMIASTGGSICLIVLIMAAFMILLATKSLKKLQNNSSEA